MWKYEFNLRYIIKMNWLSIASNQIKWIFGLRLVVYFFPDDLIQKSRHAGKGLLHLINYDKYPLNFIFNLKQTTSFEIIIQFMILFVKFLVKEHLEKYFFIYYSKRLIQVFQPKIQLYYREKFGFLWKILLI